MGDHPRLMVAAILVIESSRPLTGLPPSSLIPITDPGGIRRFISISSAMDMSIFEWFGERRNPGPIGSIDRGPAEVVHWRPRMILLRGAVALGLLISLGIGIARVANGAGETIALLVGAMAYFALAYWHNFRPDTSNVGFAGGLVDHPFRISDNVNRALVFLRVLFWPGRLVTVGLRDLIRYARGQRVMILPPP